MRIFFNLFFLTLFIGGANSQSSLNKADSLYAGGKYTEAFDIYKKMVDEGRATPASLLKMAFIKEGSEEYAKSLYYLKKYEKMTHDKATSRQIMKLAKEQELEGYSQSGRENILNWLDANRIYIQIALVLLVIFTLVLTIKQKSKWAFGVIQVLFVALLLVITNLKPETYGVISQNNVALRKESSSGANIDSNIPKKGHRVKVLSKDRIWTKVIWDDKPCYVRNSYIDEI